MAAAASLKRVIQENVAKAAGNEAVDMIRELRVSVIILPR